MTPPATCGSRSPARCGSTTRRRRPSVRSSPERRRARPQWQWLGLAAALVLVTRGRLPAAGRTAASAAVAGIDVVGRRRQRARNGSVEAVKDELTLAVQHYQKAIAELEAMARTEARGWIPTRASVVQRNLGTIDQAIAESQTALIDDPDERAGARQSLRRPAAEGTVLRPRCHSSTRCARAILPASRARRAEENSHDRTLPVRTLDHRRGRSRAAALAAGRAGGVGWPGTEARRCARRGAARRAARDARDRPQRRRGGPRRLGGRSASNRCAPSRRRGKRRP